MANKPTPADFSPTVPDFPSIGQYQPIYGKFDLTTYIQGASDYEIMTFLVQCYNATLKGYSDVTQLSKDTVTAYNQLQTWVNTWFAGLDVQEDINEKLEQMRLSGELANVISNSDSMIPAINNYFESEDGNATLKIKTSEKINEMARDGTLTEIIKGTGQVSSTVVTYLNSVDGSKKLSDATAEKIEEMANNGELGTVISKTTDLQKTTTDWLTANVTPVGSAVVVDKSLTIEGASADSKATGNSIDSLKDDLEDVNSKIDYNKTAMSFGYNSYVDVGEWESGMIYNGNNIERDYAIRTKSMVHINENMMVYDLDGDNLVWQAFQYSSGGTFEKDSTVNSSSGKVFEFDKSKLYRFIIRAADGTTPITDIYRAKNSIKFFYENDLFNEFAKKTIVDSDIADLKNYKIQTGEYELVYKNQLELRINQINDRSKEIGTNGDMFIFITDMHNPYTPFEDKPLHHRQNLRAIPLIKKVLECTPCNKVFVGGDLAFSSLSDNNTRELAYNQCRTVVNRFNELIDAPVYFIKGNHDDNGYTDNTYYTDNQLYPLFNACLEKDKDVTWGDRNKLYWYVDNPLAKIRYICLNTFPRKSDGTQSLGAEEEQKNWFRDVALTMPSNEWVAVVLAHKIHWNIQEIAKAKMDSGVNVAFCLGGHEHQDTFIPYTDLENGVGVNFVQTTCDACYADDGYSRTVGTDIENAFDVVTINKTQRKVVMYRIGAGDIRSFHY